MLSYETFSVIFKHRVYLYIPSILAEDLWRPILQLAASSYPLSWGAEEALEEPLVPTQLDIFRLLELLQLPLPFGEEVEPPREDELELLRVCKNNETCLDTIPRGQTTCEKKKLKRKLSSRSKVSFTSEKSQWERQTELFKKDGGKNFQDSPDTHIICKKTIYEIAKWKLRSINYQFIVLIMKTEEFMLGIFLSKMQ